jgi:3-oxoacyl-[acyl-carrier-protein] synthase II
VVATGVGLLTAVGNSAAELHRALLTGARASTIASFDAAAHFGSRNARPLDRISQFAAAAAGLALSDAGCDADYRARHAVGLVLGTVFAGVRTICAFDRRALEAGPSYVSPLDFANTVLNAAAGQAAIWHNLRGPNATIAAGGASGLQAIAYGAELIASGACDAILAGGADERSPEAVAALEAVDGARPPVGEGAAFVMLEEEHTARERGADVRAEIAGLASGHAIGVDGRVDPTFAADIMRRAFADASVDGCEIDAVSTAAGAGTDVDEAERRAVSLAFEGHRAPLPTIAVKTSVGDALGASGALQMIAMLEAMRHGTDIRTALIEAVGEDGNCCAVVIARPSERRA